MSWVEHLGDLFSQGKTSEALAEAREKLSSASDPDLLLIRETMGTLAQATSDATVAEQVMTVVAEASERLYRSTPRRYPLARVGLASWYAAQKRFPQARNAIEWGIRAAEAQSKPHPVTVLELFRRLAEVAWAEGKSAEEVAVLERGLEALPARELQHPDRELAREIESVQAMMARAKEAMGDIDGAIETIEKKLRLPAHSAKPAPVDEAIDWMHLAELRDSRGELETARTLMQRAVQLIDANADPTDPRRARWFATLARMDRRAGHHDEARTGFEKALELLRRAQPPAPEQEIAQLEEELTSGRAGS